MAYIEVPNLPESAVSCVIAGIRYRRELERAFEGYGIEALWLPDNPEVDKRLAGHADISIAHLGGEKILLAHYLRREEKFAASLAEKGFEVVFSDFVQTEKYPGDVNMNFCILKDMLICNRKTIDKTAEHILSGKKLLSVRQGYVKCSVCIVSDNAIITQDKGIASAAEKCGIDVLPVEPDCVKLDGFAAGFVGGAAVKLGSSVLAFTGRPERSSARSVIERFAASYGVEIVYLTPGKAFDVGSIIPIAQRDQL